MKLRLPKIRLYDWTGCHDDGAFNGLCLEILWLGKLVSVVVANREKRHG
ncbi:MAG: hypothetical protein K2X76_16120 [Sphingomonas sp.]|nr:hypothetical protein [Sphingomonas sp.]